jgi:hypothetical protein
LGRRDVVALGFREPSQEASAAEIRSAPTLEAVERPEPEKERLMKEAKPHDEQEDREEH